MSSTSSPGSSSLQTIVNGLRDVFERHRAQFYSIPRDQTPQNPDVLCASHRFCEVDVRRYIIAN